MPIPFYHPVPATPAIYGNEPLPENKANLFSRIVFQWVTPIMRVGYSRPLEADDLWTLTSDLECKTIANQLQSHFHEQPTKKGKKEKAEVYERRDSSYSGQTESFTLDNKSNIGINRMEDEGSEKEGIQKKDRRSLLRAMYMTVWMSWWKAVVFKGCAAGLQITTPLITKILIEQLTLSHDHHQDPANELPKSIGYMIGISFGLFVMVQSASLFSYQALQRGSVIGFMMRAALIDLIGRRSMKLSSKSKIEFTSGKLTTMVSADASFLDFSAPMTLDLVVQPIQIAVGLGLLIWTLGYSALVGLAVLALAGPLQAYMFSRMIKTRQSQLKYVDSRVRLLSETITSIRSVKLFSYVNFFSSKVNEMRKNELIYLKKNGFNRATMNATMAFIPTLAAVLTFVTYGLTGHQLNAATIFSGLQYFNVLKTPISFLPMCFTAVSDALVGIRRIESLFHAEEIPSKLNIDHQSKYAIDIKGDFQFESSPESENASEKNSNVKNEKESKTNSEPFALRGINLKVPRGSLVCVVGRVGTGKSALLSSMIGDMKQLSGHTVFGSDISYVPQYAWIHSGSVRDNITFSASPEEIDFDRLNMIIDSCALRDDINNMPNGDLTNVGEKGLLLSGGQRQRISIARSMYSNSSITLMDDPLSAVDVNVSKHILQNCLLKQGTQEAKEKTKVIVTHQVDLLPHADLSLVLDRDDSGQGRIVQQGTFEVLIDQTGPFRSFISEHKSYHRDTPSSPPSIKTEEAESKVKTNPVKNDKKQKTGVTDVGMEEDRQIGSIPWSVYTTYFKSMGNILWPLTFGIMLLLTQVVTVGNSLWLGWWSANKFDVLGQGGYMGIYAALGFAIGFFTWAASYTMFVAGLKASYRLFEQAWGHVMRAPVNWHDQTPSGRIINRLSKDIEMLDDRMAFSWETLLVNGLAAVGTFGLILYTYPWLGIAFIPLCLFYWICGSYYRQTSREIKRIDSITRSNIYSSFGEQLTGLSVIRAFGKQDIFQDRMQKAINVEGRAYILTLVIQRWLGVRLDLSSNLLILLIAIFGILFRYSVNPSSFGVVFSYALSAAQLFSNLVSLYAQVELEMNNAERILHYTSLPLEPSPYLPEDPPEAQWPTKGEMIFRNVSLKYSDSIDSPWVLKKLRFSVESGEKIGIIGRTGAGKSSLVNAILRMNDIKGEIRVDGLNLSKIGLDTVRERIAIIPQDAFLFEGTVRDNLDPLSIHNDDYLNPLLSLIHSDPLLPASQSTKDKFKLDSQVTSEGTNFSAGEKQLLALIRALARNTKILLLDEATSSVDPETDALIQRIIQNHLNGVTLISIAHRLQTVAYYDRILVLDQGRVVEYHTPLSLYDIRDSIFRQLCDRVQLRRIDLLKLRHDALYAFQAAKDDTSLFNHYSIAEAWAQGGGVRVSGV